MTRGCVLALALLSGGCVDAISHGLPPLVQGCTKDSDCPPGPWLCADGGCEDWQCQSSCDCPSPVASYGCVNLAGLSYCLPGSAPSYPCTLPDGGPALCSVGSCDGG